MANNCVQRVPLANKEWRSIPQWDTNHILSTWMADIKSQTRNCIGEDMEKSENLPAAEESIKCCMQVLWKTIVGQVLKRLSVEFLYYLAVLFLDILFSSDKNQWPMCKLEHEYL